MGKYYLYPAVETIADDAQILIYDPNQTPPDRTITGAMIKANVSAAAISAAAAAEAAAEAAQALAEAAEVNAEAAQVAAAGSQSASAISELAAEAAQVAAAQSAEDAATTLASKANINDPTFSTKISTPQIKFPSTAVPSADPNILDDYEEGTFTPTITPSTSGSITSINNGRYLKMGQLVFITMTFSVSSVSSPVGELRLGNLPFIPSFGSAASVYANELTSGATTALEGRLVAGDDYIVIFRFSAGSALNAASYVKTTTYLTVTVVYLV